MPRGQKYSKRLLEREMAAHRERLCPGELFTSQTTRIHGDQRNSHCFAARLIEQGEKFRFLSSYAKSRSSNRISASSIATKL